MKTMKPRMIFAMLAAVFTVSVSAQTWVWTGAENQLFSNPNNWLVNAAVPASGPNAGTRLNYEFSLASGGTINLDGGTNFAAASIVFGAGAGSFTFQTADNTHFRNATAHSATSAMSITQNSSSPQTFAVNFAGMHDGANFSGTGTGNLLFQGELQMFNRSSQLNVNTTSYRPIWSGVINNNNPNRTRNFGGSGTFEISGISTGSNTTAMTKSGTGTLLITNPTGYALGNVPLNANAGTLAGTGSVTQALLTVGGAMTLSPGMHGATVSPGSETGTLTSNNMRLNDGFIYNWEYRTGNNSSDLFHLLGTLDLNDANTVGTTINVIGLDAQDLQSFGGSLTLFRTDGGVTGAVPGDGILEWTVSVDGNTNSGWFAQVQGDDIVLAIPEPGTLLLLGFAVALLMQFRRHR